MRILYFAWLRQRLGIEQEDVAPPATVTTVGELLEWLRGRGPTYADVLKNPSIVRVAVNQEYARLPDPVRAGDEIAIFPPVTGGAA
ncbi:MAG: molybdopterin converting factor subunit 1 [Alphaproteobacteria bacterium]|nr:molybdopterin converting factor subunit 1 [Alphaproteobacteria bacterium]